MSDSELEDERGALITGVIALVVILLLGAPCFCYFGSGFYMGLERFSAGKFENKAREGKRKYVRPEKYNRRFQKPSPASPSK